MYPSCQRKVSTCARKRGQQGVLARQTRAEVSHGKEKLDDDGAAEPAREPMICPPIRRRGNLGRR